MFVHAGWALPRAHTVSLRKKRENQEKKARKRGKNMVK
jgi:hypothetical protein